MQLPETFATPFVVPPQSVPPLRAFTALPPAEGEGLVVALVFKSRRKHTSIDLLHLSAVV
jgi:hypothetical protein